MHQLSKILACEHPTKQKMKAFWNLSGSNPPFSRNAAGLAGAQRGVTLQQGHVQETKKSKNPASSTEPSPHEEFQFYREKSKASSLL